MAKLNIKQRFDLQKYTGLMHSTISVRLAIEPLWKKLTFTPQEIDEYEIRPDGTGISFNNESYTIDVSPEDVGPVICGSMRYYIADHAEGNEDNELYKSICDTFNLILSDIPEQIDA